MKILVFIFIISMPAFSQSLSPEDQKRLLEENSALKKENQQLKEELSRVQGPSGDTARMMEVLQKGKKYQEDQLRALEELEKEE